MPLLDNLTAQLADKHIAAIHALSAHTPRIARAERLAERFQGAGIQATATGHVRDDGSVSLWVQAEAPLPRVEAAMARLDLAEDDRIPCSSVCEIRLQGFDFPVYVRHPAPSATA